MTPPTLPTQTTLASRVDGRPPAPVWTYNDYWGTQVTVSTSRTRTTTW